MDSTHKAKEHICQLRKARHFNGTSGTGGDANTRSLSRALDMLSAQLYSKPTPFILEIIQNADDNTYAVGEDPTLTLIYSDEGHLWVGCDEVGFAKENVSAIGETADSTKKVAGASRKGYIGEKGIGFKSVFKVASTVWVSSGAYTFKFNRDDLLGMIVPVWADFNGTAMFKEWTIFCPHIPEHKDRQAVRGNMLALGAELLLFLRKLRHIHVRVVSSNESKVDHEYLLHREDAECGTGCQITTLTREDIEPSLRTTQEKLAVFRRTGDKMPKEKKREGITESEIIVAFPVSKDTKTSRKTYNFLPIRDYGLPFLFQADFILTASRQDIIERNAWNEALEFQAHLLFVQSVEFFNKNNFFAQFDTFKYTWPKFTISVHTASETTTEGFLKNLRRYLRDQPVIQSQTGHLSPPNALIIVPEKFWNDNGRPLFDEVESLSSYVGPRYSTIDVNLLESTLNLQKTPVSF